MRRVYQPRLDDSTGAVPIDTGGSSSKKLVTAVQYLGLLTNANKGIPLGAADLDANGKVKHAILPDSIISEVVNVSGPFSLKISQTGIYTITDFDSNTVYDVAAMAGIVSRIGDTITYTADAIPGNGGFTLNGKSYIIPVTYYSVVTPNVISPTNNQTGLSGTVEFTSNSFAMEGGTDTHVSSDWQLSTVNDFSSLVNSIADSSGNKTTWSVSGLNPNTTYYVRVRYKASTSEYSSWSPIVSFMTSTSFAPNAPNFTNPTNGQTSVAISTTFTASAFSSPGVDTHYSSDWQIATDAGFSNIIKSATDDTINTLSWPVSGLVDLTTYYARVRYKGATFGYGAWSPTTNFTTIQSNSINTPSVASPVDTADGVSLSPTLTSSAFSVTGGSDTHQSTDWQIATDAGFTNIVKSTAGDTVNKTSWSVTGLTPGLTYYVRVRYKGVVLPYSAWSVTSYFSTIHLNRPSISSPTTGATGLIPSMTLTGSAFGVTGASDTHASSTWQIATDAGFTNIAIESVNSTTNKTSWTVNLNLNTTYYARVRYTGTTYGASSWSPTVSFSTIADYSPNTPNITSPTTGATNQGPTVSFTSSAFTMIGGSATHTSSDWQIASDAGFTTIVSSATNDTTKKVSWTSASLAVNTTFYARVRYIASNGIYSAWSSVISFTTKAVYIPDVEQAVITGPVSNSGYGVDVDISDDGTRVVIGAYNANTRGYQEEGAAYVYLKNGTSWTLEATLINNYSPQHYSSFGWSVAINNTGTCIAIGCYLYDDAVNSRTDVGALFVFKRSGTTWTSVFSEKFYIDSNVMGFSIDISDDGKTIIIGVPNHSYDGRAHSGTALVYYEYINNSYTATTYLARSLSYANYYTGWDVAISGDGTRAIVASRYGQYYVYRLNNGSATYEATLSVTAHPNDSPSVAMNKTGDVVAIGCSIVAAGVVYIFRRTGTSWSGTPVTLAPPNLVSNDRFGISVSLNGSGTMLAVGAMNATRSGFTTLGSVYLYTYNGTNWLLNSEILPSVKASSSYFGKQVALNADGSSLIVGNNVKNKVYIYK